MKQADNFNAFYSPEYWLQICEGNITAFGELVDHNFNPLYHYGTRFTPDKGLIKDCIQDLFLEIWEKRAKLTHIVSIKAYLFQSLRNNLITRIKKQSRFSDFSENEEFASQDDSPELAWITDETDALTSSRLETGIEMLPKRQREALYLKYYQDLSNEEIAGIMGLQKQAVANYIHYGILKLREYWKYKTILLAMIIDYIN
ncbi:RNA polymerase sigma factor [Dyadobacter sp. CY347]|uniref:RNA polymerase sigma factor n=1 Tax=Dyadobacter sp. CY347 TaxID=2909336 RepID=UPI001F18D62B|nr:sigma-70 family RNA polymerase sigma factor [Dyadobacter sp. CY347]MCF2489254.1 sigma-70 family RNA polymerase sigma factor [Dyadobacter sp. CY347]